MKIEIDIKFEVGQKVFVICTDENSPKICKECNTRHGYNNKVVETSVERVLLNGDYSLEATHDITLLYIVAGGYAKEEQIFLTREEAESNINLEEAVLY